MRGKIRSIVGIGGIILNLLLTYVYTYTYKVIFYPPYLPYLTRGIVEIGDII
jgi:hypothetical protein